MLQILVIIAFVISLLVFALVLWLNRKTNQLLKEKEQKITQLEEQNTIARNEISELRNGLLSIGKRLLDVEQLSNNIQEQQQQMSYVDPESKIYSRAVKMVELGADIDEVIRECELPRAEAELLFSLHQNNS